MRCLDLIFEIVQTDLWFYILTEIPRNGGDDKSKNVERNPSSILPGKFFYFLHWLLVRLTEHKTTDQSHIIQQHTSSACLFLSVSHTYKYRACCVSSTRWVLHLAALQPVRGPRCLPPVCGWQRALREHHRPGPRHHGLEKHPEGLLHPRRHHRHRPSAAGPWHVRGKSRALWMLVRMDDVVICTFFLHHTPHTFTHLLRIIVMWYLKGVFKPKLRIQLSSYRCICSNIV